MSSAKDDDDYWYGSDKRSFCFESNERDNLFGVSKSGTALLRAGISNIQIPENYLKNDDRQWNLKPLLSVISDKTLNYILTADKAQQQNDEVNGIHQEITLKKILQGQVVSLESYKSLASKTSLLDAAIASGNGNAILGIVLFIMKTLKTSLAQKLLMERPEAMNAYLHYLSTRLQRNEITDLLTMQGLTVDAAIRDLHLIIKNTSNSERLLQRLRNCHKTLFMDLQDCPETKFIELYIKLLEWQLDVKDTQLSKQLEVNSPLLKCLEHTCRDHWDSSEGNLISPTTLLKQHQISPRQYEKVALKTRATEEAWDDIDRLLHTKSWLGGKKLQTSLPIEEILKILQDCKAPNPILEKFLGYVDNIKKRLDIAKSIQCYKSVIDILVSQGDRTALLEYKASLQPQSEQYFYAENFLHNPGTKWRN
ncbi:spermatogenesis-defective protein 39 homolog [Leptopilina boulardi]|uniref:spermatogenesis-defective protein 39 homolog n=1 Tax=Leptopilina boulardi TaxID=63433 RepID=UPI0021F688B0|nr:spermatogenesis-defective protein 39 homolog [Leptopilina boulardi]